MRDLLLAALAAGLCCAPAVAQDRADDVQQLRAEVERLRAENAKLGGQLKACGDLLRQSAEAAAAAKKVAGVWVIETARRDGRDVPSDAGGRVEFVGNVVIARLPGSRKPIRLEFAVEPGRGLLSFLPLEGGAAAPSGTSFDLVTGRYEWAGGDALRVSLQSAYTLPKEVSDRGQVLWVLKRQKP